MTHFCKNCGSKTEVIATAPTDSFVRRRRHCPDCETRTTTFEVPQEVFISLSQLVHFAAQVRERVVEAEDLFASLAKMKAEWEDNNVSLVMARGNYRRKGKDNGRK
jgi:hypothetical protein